MTQSAEHSTPDWRTWVEGSPGETPPCTLMALGASKIRRGCSVLQVPIQISPLGVLRRGANLHPVGDQSCDGMSSDHP